ncbi:MAG: hypothetical protein V1877_01065 [Candidatus Tagabacteria bacterium]
MFLEFIEKLQKKPETSRKKILAVSLFFTMAAIIAVWLTVFNLNFKSGELKKVSAPFNLIKEDLKDFYGLFKK